MLSGRRNCSNFPQGIGNRNLKIRLQNQIYSVMFIRGFFNTPGNLPEINSTCFSGRTAQTYANIGNEKVDQVTSLLTSLGDSMPCQCFFCFFTCALVSTLWVLFCASSCRTIILLNDCYIITHPACPQLPVFRHQWMSVAHGLWMQRRQLVSFWFFVVFGLYLI